MTRSSEKLKEVVRREKLMQDRIKALAEELREEREGPAKKQSPPPPQGE